MQKTPLVFIHTGQPDYLLFTVKQAKHFWPKAEVHLVGDEANKNSGEDFHHNLKKYLPNASTFNQIYIHLSAGSESFERFCFSRWFVLQALVEENNWEYCWCIDSDVLLFEDLEEATRQLQGKDIAVSFAGVPSAVYFSREGISKFCQYIINLYLNKKPYLQQCFDHYLNKNPGITNGGITDMHAFWMFVQEEEVLAEDLAMPDNGAVFDQDIHQPQGFKFDDNEGEKVIHWSGGRPYFIQEHSGLVVRANNLHLASGAKETIHRRYRAHGLHFLWFKNELKLQGKILRKNLSQKLKRFK